MSKVIAGMTLSLDGFVNDKDGSVEVLYPDMAALHDEAPLKEAIENTGAAVMGWNTFTMAEDPDWYAVDYEFQVPIFVLTHAAPKKKPKEALPLTFTFVTDGIQSAIQQAKAAAGDKWVTVIGGASTTQQCLRAGLVDELYIDIMPVLLGSGLRLFEATDSPQVKLERLAVLELPGGKTHLRYRVIK